MNTFDTSIESEDCKVTVGYTVKEGFSIFEESPLDVVEINSIRLHGGAQFLPFATEDEINKLKRKAIAHHLEN